MTSGHWILYASLGLIFATTLQGKHAAEVGKDIGKNGGDKKAKEALDELVNKRQLKDDGFCTFDVVPSHVELPDQAKGRPDSFIRRRRDTTGGYQPIRLRIEADEPIILELVPARPVVNDRASIKIHTGGLAEVWRGDSRGCYYRGHVEGNPAHTASFTFCRKMMGTFTDGMRSYWVESLGPVNMEGAADNDTTGEYVPERALLASRDANQAVDDADVPHSQAEITNIANEIRERYRGSPRFKRQTSSTSITVEIAVVADAAYTAGLVARGHVTQDEMVDVMTLKWNAVQAEWGRAFEDAGSSYDVILDIKLMDFWTTDKAWYLPNMAGGILQTHLTSFCTNVGDNNLYGGFDHIHLFTGTTGWNVAGKGFQGTICEFKKNCAVSTETGVAEFMITAHELGHLFNMQHDGDVGCTGADFGIMGYKVYGWSTCSVTSFLDKMTALGGSSCLNTDNVNTDDVDPLIHAWPGMAYTDDEICEFKLGAGYKFRRFPYQAWGECTLTSCTNMDPASSDYGVSVNFATPTDGHYCGDQMVCSSYLVNGVYPCLTWTETGLDQSDFTVVTGGWSAWGALTSCSRTCGTGVQYRERTCTNPKPLNTPGCTGSAYDASTCNDQACQGDESDETALINQRASETCTSWKANNMYETIGQSSSDYTNSGSVFTGQGLGQCEVKCDTRSGFTAPNNQRLGLMPDGTPCPGSATGFVHRLPRSTGNVGRCVQGSCQEFNCEGTTSDTVPDQCGICGGDGTSCDAVEGIFSDTVNQNTRATMVVVPAGSWRIQAWFEYNTDMQNYFIELRSKEGNAILASLVPVTDAAYINTNNLDNPTYFAGTHWYYHATEQYLYAVDPTDVAVQLVEIQFYFTGTHWYYNATEQYLYAVEPTDVAVQLVLYNHGTNSNQGVNYAYSKPLACSAETCDNGGSWNTATCTCDCPDGFYEKYSTAPYSIDNWNRIGVGSFKTDCSTFINCPSKTVLYLVTRRSDSLSHQVSDYMPLWFKGQTCSSPCSRYCKNGQTVNDPSSASCYCDCQGNTEGNYCDCKSPFTGLNCQSCVHSECQNGGTLDSATCQCTCRPGYADLDCSAPCQDRSDEATCNILTSFGLCPDNLDITQDCYKSCGHCTEGSGTTTTTTTSTSSTSTTSTTTSSTTSTTTTTAQPPADTTTTTTATTSTTSRSTSGPTQGPTTSQAPVTTQAPSSTTDQTSTTTNSNAAPRIRPSWMQATAAILTICLTFV